MSELLHVGRISRAHGLKGQVHVDLTTDRTERLDQGSRLLAGDRWIEVEHAARHGQTWLVRFVGVNDRDAAEALVRRSLQAEPIDDPDAFWVHDMVGAEVVEVSGVARGRCVAIHANPAHDMLELDSGALVPVTFVHAVADGVITIDPPEGLFDLD